MLTNQAVISNTFRPNKPTFEQNPKKISGFDLERIIELAPFPSRIGRLLKFACNLAATTSEFVIYKSQKTLAQDADCSVSTLQRAYRVAVSIGVLSLTPVYDDKTRARKANLYRFTPEALSFVDACLKALQEAKIKVSASQKTVRGIVAKVFALFNFAPQPPCQNEQTPPCQNDRQEVILISKKRKKLQVQRKVANAGNSKSGESAVTVTTQSQVVNTLAIAKSRADNARIAEKHEKQRNLLDRLFSKFSQKPKPVSRPDRDLPCANMTPDYSYTPTGFRGEDDYVANENANATAAPDVRITPEQD